MGGVGGNFENSWVVWVVFLKTRVGGMGSSVGGVGGVVRPIIFYVWVMWVFLRIKLMCGWCGQGSEAENQPVDCGFASNLALMVVSSLVWVAWALC